MKRNRFLRFIVEPGEQAGGGGGETPDPVEKPDEPLGESGLKALKSERAARAEAEKQAAEFAARIKEFEDAQKSEAEKQAERLAELEKSARENEIARVRYEVAAEVGLSLDAAKRLHGASREELSADAVELKALLDSAVPNVPRPDHSQGGGDDTKPGGVQAGRDLFRERHKSNS